MFSVTILGSGSAGNAAVVESGSTRILVDAGLSARQLSLRLEQAGIAPDSLDAILVTHEHADHAQGLAVFCKKRATGIFCNAHTAQALKQTSMVNFQNWRLFSTGSDFTVGDFSIQTFSVPHDAADPVGFVLRCGGSALGYLTDLGFATKLVQERIREVHTLFIETNHDEKLLQDDTRRPWAVKQRIMSRHGHLSNAAAAEVVAGSLHQGLQRVILGHLSRDCNTPELAATTMLARLEREGSRHVAVEAIPHGGASPRFTVGGGTSSD